MVTIHAASRRTNRVTASARRSANRRSQNREDSPPDSPDSRSSPYSSTITPESVHSPYYLSNNDHPGLSLTSELLDGTSYDDWSLAMYIALNAKNKRVFVDGSLSRPKESSKYFAVWFICNSMIHSWLLHSVTKNIAKSILRFQDASEIWQDLKTRFHITSLPWSYQLTQQIWNLHQGTLDLATYFTTLKTLWDELDSSTCIKVCHHCDCCKATDRKTDHSKVIKFLAGLNESYAVVRSQIIMKKNIPSLSEIYNLLDQDHSQSNIAPSQNAYAFLVAAPDVASNTDHSYVNATQINKGKRFICSNCGYNDHIVDKCYKIHGYPPGFKHKQKQENEKYVKVSPVVAQLSLENAVQTVKENPTSLITNLSKTQINDLIAYFNTQIQPSATHVASTSRATITALPGSYQGVDDWTG